MSSLPAPARFLKISELAGDPGRYQRELEDGGVMAGIPHAEIERVTRDVLNDPENWT